VVLILYSTSSELIDCELEYLAGSSCGTSNDTCPVGVYNYDQQAPKGWGHCIPHLA
jgi:hypothetical protein